MSCTPGGGQCPVGQTCARDGSQKKTCVPESIINFSPGPNLNELPSCMRDAVTRSINGEQTTTDDMLMGKLGQPYDARKVVCNGEPIIPYCQQEQFKATSYCACQNVGVPHAACIFEPCQGAQYAYKTTQQRSILHNPAKLCPQEIVCQNIIDVGGKNNVTQAYQNSNCGGTVNKIYSQIRLHPAISLVLLVLIILLAITIAAPSSKKKSLPPLGVGGLAGLPPLPGQM